MIWRNLFIATEYVPTRIDITVGVIIIIKMIVRWIITPVKKIRGN